MIRKLISKTYDDRRDISTPSKTPTQTQSSIQTPTKTSFDRTTPMRSSNLHAPTDSKLRRIKSILSQPLIDLGFISLFF